MVFPVTLMTKDLSCVGITLLALLIDLKTLSPEQDVLVAEVFERIAAETPENAPETDPKRASTDQNASLTE